MLTADPVSQSAAAQEVLDGILPPGSYYLNGDEAAAEGAIAANARFFAAYPITPATEVAERCAERFPECGGTFIQMEDELAAMNCILGGAWAGAKALTSTSGPGFSLMMENLGLGIMTETPCVVVNVQRAGPSTGLPTAVAQQDMMQARWGSHGDYEIIALAPDSPCECFTLAIRCFNLSEQFRTPVLLMSDEIIGHMTEKVLVPAADEIEIVPRRLTDAPKDEYWPYVPDDDLVPAMANAGTGYRYHVTGLTHDYRGYPALTPEDQHAQVTRLKDKILTNKDKIITYEMVMMDDAEVCLLSYGSASRVARSVVDILRQNGIKAGLLRLITVWPFPEEIVYEVANQVKAIVVPEINMGQIVREVERAAKGCAQVKLVPHAGGDLHDEPTILKAVQEGLR
ncbi:MAG: 2-oxoacid:acceptor oxidoreductase subunit alpha [Planctomycetota bacterium]|jgi:2-oxoglutarate ferredoxin oxidoreductase subunit alpha|nr:2-oxoacid:acceptor oxidoreductase subunit alpha [Planctomycetota bacterium]